LLNLHTVPVKVLDSNANGSWAGIIAGIDWVIEQHKKSTTKRSVVNMSLGGDKNSAGNRAIARATEAGIVVVVAAGNADAGKEKVNQIMLHGNHVCVTSTVLDLYAK
jgi:subtilisin family serine protease